MITERERFIALVDNDVSRRTDAIVLLEGDGTARVDACERLLRSGIAPRIVVSGGIDAEAQGSIHGRKLVQLLRERHVADDEIILEDRSLHTRAQAVELMELIRQHGWRGITLVGSHYHQYRAYLTFLKAMREAGREVIIVNAPARDLPWYAPTPWGRRVDLLESEFEKIERYRGMGHLATFAEAIEYQRWKEEQP